MYISREENRTSSKEIQDGIICLLLSILSFTAGYSLLSLWEYPDSSSLMFEWKMDIHRDSFLGLGSALQLRC